MKFYNLSDKTFETNFSTDDSLVLNFSKEVEYTL